MILDVIALDELYIVKKFIQYYIDGYTFYEISSIIQSDIKDSEVFDKTHLYKRVFTQITEDKLELHKQSLSQRIQDFYQSGLPFNVIAKKLGVSTTIVQKSIKKEPF